jgi:hypothetical protein
MDVLLCCASIFPFYSNYTFNITKKYLFSWLGAWTASHYFFFE